MAATSSDVVVDDAGNVCLDIKFRQLSLGDEPPPLLLSLPQDPLLHIISLLDVVDLLKFEAAAKSAAQIGGCAEWERRLRQMLTGEALAACAAGVGNVDTTLPITGDGARRTLCTMLRVPFVVWGHRFLPETAKAAQDAFEGAGGVVECEACWPIALRPEHLDRWWSAQPLGQIFVVLTELEVEEKLHALTSPAIVAEVKPGPPHRDVTICLGTCGPAHDRAPEVNVDLYLPFGRSVDARFNLLAEVSLLELCDAIRYGSGDTEERWRAVATAAMGTARLLARARTDLPEMRFTRPGMQVADLIAWRTGDGPDSAYVADLNIGLLEEGNMDRHWGNGRHWGTRVDRHPFLSPPYGFNGPEALADAAISSVLFGGAPGGYVLDWNDPGNALMGVPWGGSAWFSGRDWWGCYMWAACRVLAPGERTSEWADNGLGEGRLAMLRVVACTTD